MKFKKIIAAISTAAIAASMTVPVMAATTVSEDTLYPLSASTKLNLSNCPAYYCLSKAVTTTETSDISAMLDGDVTTTKGAQNQGAYVIDLGANHEPITKISVKGASTTAVLVFAASGDYTLENAYANKVSLLRTNGTNQAYGTVTEHTEKEVTTVSVNSDVADYRYLIIEDWSNWWSVGELEVYTGQKKATIVRTTNDEYTTATTRTFNGDGVSMTDVWSFESFDATNLFDGDTTTTCSLDRNNYIDKDIIIDLGSDVDINKLVFSNIRSSVRIAYGSSAASTIDTVNGSISLPYGYRLNSSYSNTSNGKVQDGTTVTFGTETSSMWDTVTVSAITGGVRYIVLDTNGTGTSVGEITAYSSVSTTTYDVTANNGITVDKSTGLSEGDEITVTTPDNMIAGSLVVYDATNGTKLTVTDNKFTMPKGDVNITCLTTDTNADIILGTYADRAFARADHDMDITYNVTLPDGKVVDTALLYIPYKTNGWNKGDMCLKSGDTVIWQLENVDDINGFDVAAYVTNGTNTFTITNSKASGVDYYSSSDASSAEKLPRLVVTYKDAPVVEAITMTPSFVGSYEGDTDGSVAVAYTAKFTSTTGDTATLNVGDITWKIDGADLAVADDNTITNVTVTLSDDAAVVYGVVIAGIAEEGTLTASFN